MKERVYEFEYLSQLLNARGNRLNTLVSAVELKVGDNVIIEKENRGIFLGKITKRLECADAYDSDYKYIGDAGDAVAAYVHAFEKKVRKEELRKEMEAKFKEIDKERKFEYYATLDESFGELYKEYKELQK